MNRLPRLEKFEPNIPLVGNINKKTPFAYHATRTVTEIFNLVQLAATEAYINGLEVPDFVLKSLFDTCMPIILGNFPSLFVPYEWVLYESENLAEGSDQLMKTQYNLPQEMFRLMLGESELIYPKYSMALWEKGATNLEQAQKQMIDDVCEKLEIKDGDYILDVGCGWGCIPNYLLAKFPNVRCAGLNLSHEQCSYIRQKMQNPKSFLSSHRFTLYEKDFNQAVFGEKFDKIISLGAFEHIGNLSKSFAKLASFLKKEGRVFIHIMTLRAPNNVSSIFTHHYIFPYGRFWNYEEIPRKNKDLKTVKQWYLNGLNYSKTYTEWLQNFDHHQEQIKKLYFGLEFQKFRRLWRFYLLWFARNFASADGKYNGNGQYLLVHA